MGDAHRFNPTILRASDIRGVYNHTLFDADAAALGRAFGTEVVAKGGQTVCVGRDGRLSSPALEEQLVKGLVSTGLEVWRVGCGPSPMLYYATKTQQADAGIMVTGSHNPGDNNGFKMVLGAKPFFGSCITALGERAAKGDFVTGKGTVKTIDVMDDYVAELAAVYSTKKMLSVVWDAGNGVAGPVVERLVRKLPGMHTLLHTRLDGNFPNHHPDPTEPENLQELIQTVLETGADFGVGFDGDGDRIGVVDGKGRILWGDQLMLLFAKDVLESRPNSTIVADVKASQTLFDAIADMGGKPLMWKTGRSFIQSKMLEENAPLAGEMSGHIFFADRYYGYDDAVYAAMRLLDIAARMDETLNDFADKLPAVFNTPEFRIACDDVHKFTVVTEILDRLEKAGADINRTDGARVNTADGWWLVRASNTQPLLVARCEASSKEGLQKLKQQLADQLQQSGVDTLAVLK